MTADFELQKAPPKEVRKNESGKTHGQITLCEFHAAKKPIPLSENMNVLFDRFTEVG